MYFEIMSAAGRYYSLPELKALWRRYYTRSALMAMPRADYNKAGYACLEDTAWMRRHSGYVPQALMSEVQSRILRA